MASDFEDVPETPVVSRRVVKLKRRNKDETTTNKSNNNNNNNQNGSEKLPEKSPRIKSLNITKILGKMKNSSNYSGFISSSSFNGNNNNNNNDNIKKNWKTESLFDDNGQDELFPDLIIEKEIKRKKEIQLEKIKEKESKEMNNIDNTNDNNNNNNNKTKTKSKKINSKSSKSRKTLDKEKAEKLIDENPPQVYPSSSPERENFPTIDQDEEEKNLKTAKPSRVTQTTLKKRGRPKKNKDINEVINQTKSSKRMEKIKEKPKVKENNVENSNEKSKRQTKISKQDQKINKKRKSKDNNNNNNNNNTKNKDNDDLSLSLFEILDIDENKQINNNQDNDNDEVFILDSPIKKTKRRKISKEKNNNEILNDYNNNEDLNFDKELVKEDENLLKEREQQEILAEMQRHSREEKQRHKREYEEKLKLEKLERKREKQERLELERQIQLKRERKRKKLETLEKLKESISTVMDNKNHIETVMIPLKNDDNDLSNNSIKLRRSSLNARGKRLSSVGNGFTAIPHDDIPINELHKHIDISLPDAHKLKQLLVWLSKRIIKQGWDKFNNDAEDEDDDVKRERKDICKIIMNEFIDDLIQGRVNIDWWGVNKANNYNSITEPIIVHKNNANIENEKKLEFYDNELKKLQKESKIWQELKIKNNNPEYDILLKEINSTNKPINILNKDSQIEENKKLQDFINLSYERTDKLDHLIHRLQVSNDLIQRIMLQKNEIIAENLKQQSQIDVLNLLKKSI